MSLRSDIKHLIGEQLPIQVVVGTAVAIKESDMTCTVEVDGRPTRYEVRLRSVISDDKGVIEVPKVNSRVLVALVENNPGSSFVVATSEVASLQVNFGTDRFMFSPEGMTGSVGTSALDMSAQGFEFSRSGESLKALLQDTLTAIQQITVPTPAGVSGVPNNIGAFEAIKTRIQTLLKA